MHMNVSRNYINKQFLKLGKSEKNLWKKWSRPIIKYVLDSNIYVQ